MNVILHKDYHVEQNDFTNAGRASSQIKNTLKQIGISPAVMRRVSVAAYEAEINLLIHAYGGDISLDLMDNGDIKLRFSDKGPGIEDIEKALTPGFSTASEKAREMGFGAGMGIPNIKRVSDEFSIVSSPAGTIIDVLIHADE